MTVLNLAPAAGGKLWLVGLMTGSNATVPVVGRLLADAGMDPTWEDGGFAQYAFDGGPDAEVNVEIETAQVASDGRLVLGMTVSIVTTAATYPAMLRYCP